jgi:hypothetical protein
MAMAEREPERGSGDDVAHLRGKDHRSADDTGHGHPRPDEVGSTEPIEDEDGRSRYTGHGRETPGAFGEEDTPVDRPLV